MAPIYQEQEHPARAYDSAKNANYTPSKPLPPIPSELVGKMRYIIKELEHEIAYEFCSRFFSTTFFMDYDEVHQSVYAELYSEICLPFYLYHRPGYRVVYPVPGDWQKNRETPLYKPSDIAIYQRYPMRYRKNFVFIQILREMGIDIMDWMLVQRKMALSAQEFEKEPLEMVDASKWLLTVSSLVERMEPRWSDSFRQSLRRVVEQAMKYSLREAGKTRKRITPDIFGDCKNLMTVLPCF
ncbi:hypothetical protein TWF718_003847 [Orbilia javanica]|uniref:Uncharacterized protein n=1 Tax=Orbilia javanica TaxID=47235 RepID=A0AAN8N1I4_9PEZI